MIATGTYTQTRGTEGVNYGHEKHHPDKRIFQGLDCLFFYEFASLAIEVLEKNWY
jgi:hypothetical protein